MLKCCVTGQNHSSAKGVPLLPSHQMMMILADMSLDGLGVHNQATSEWEMVKRTNVGSDGGVMVSTLSREYAINHLLPIYMAPNIDGEAFALDFMSQDWKKGGKGLSFHQIIFVEGPGQVEELVYPLLCIIL